ncbi:DedA family protein [Rathayibacter tritici]|uniref:DedA family protein n=1 Tax=Rathayibacter tritici TaxID=33888 RepID=UPI000CE747C2|nr:DedA family protein [Rathayibacter tritici]PPF30883.1 DedA family protein [Rathayibacter tritici]PPF66365.1 DedA family protein [Rathayibacter tritici]PPG09544.1 DedA family protein [Rathayibacter tritici]PPI13644.1 DedA family protein [Rathayibacter tritici]
MNDTLTDILDVVVGVPPIWRTLLAGLAIFFETTILAGLIVPGDTIVIVSATGVTSPLQFVALAVTVVIGALCGESVGFYLGRWFGPRIRTSRLGRRLGEKNWLRAERYLARRGGIAVFLSRFLPVLHSLIPLTVGMSGMRYRTFMAWTIPACVLWSSAYVGVGAAAAGSYRELSESLHGAGYIFVGVIVVFALLVLLGKKLLNRAEARHLDE